MKLVIAEGGQIAATKQWGESQAARLYEQIANTTTRIGKVFQWSTFVS